MTEYIKINGGKKLEGNIKIAGAKNAALPILMASILSSSQTTLHNIPLLTDIDNMILILKELGLGITKFITDSNSGVQTINIFPTNKINSDVTSDVVSGMRASIWTLGPILAKYGKIIISLPGGCKLGTRNIDMHLDALRKMGAEININNGKIYAKSNKKLNGINYKFDKVSVGATANILMASCLAEGTTKLSNCAIEPEITDLANFLFSIGADISGIGTSNLKIEGVKNLNSSEYTVIPDRLEAATYALAAAITKGNVVIEKIRPDIISNIIEYLTKTGIGINIDNDKLHIISTNIILPTNIKTAPYPGFPTDMQSQFCALLSIANGKSRIKETIFENRFAHLHELKKMGAEIEILDNQNWIIQGKDKLYGAKLVASDLRGAACLIVAALGASGISTIHNLQYLDRGYAKLEDKLSNLGADIKRINSTLSEYLKIG